VCHFETKVWRNKTAPIVQQIIPSYFDNIQEFFKFEKPVFTVVNSTVEGHTWQLQVACQMFIFCYQGSSKQCSHKQAVFNNKTFITHLLQNKTKICKKNNRTISHFKFSIAYKTSNINKEVLNYRITYLNL